MKENSAKYLVAVSGGVDSVVLLDMLAKQHKEIIVAHFDHGIRKSSAADADFVKKLAYSYGADFFVRREELGENVSEEKARERRYRFLRQISKEQNAKLVTAHHLDDVFETIIINLMRGTGWRGLAVLNADDIERPLIGMQKSEIINYANENDLEWREDETNRLDDYTRNIVRHKIKLEDSVKDELEILYKEQLKLAKEIKSEVSSLFECFKNSNNKYSRYFIGSIDTASAYEIIRELTDGKLLPPQIDQTIHAIKTQQAGTVFEASKNIRFYFDTRFFTFKLLK